MAELSQEDKDFIEKQRAFAELQKQRVAGGFQGFSNPFGENSKVPDTVKDQVSGLLAAGNPHDFGPGGQYAFGTNSRVPPQGGPPGQPPAEPVSPMYRQEPVSPPTPFRSPQTPSNEQGTVGGGDTNENLGNASQGASGDSSTTHQIRSLINEERKDVAVGTEALGRANADGEEARAMQAGDDITNAKLRAEEAEVYQNEAQKLQMKTERKEEIRQAELQKQEEQYNQAIKDIDPNHFWKSTGFGDHETANRIFAGLGAALAGFGGTGGQYLSNLQHNIDRDVGLQKDKAESHKTLLSMMRNRFGDERTAESATRLAMYEMHINQINTMLAKAKPGEIKDALAVSQAEARKGYAKQMYDFKHAGNQTIMAGLLSIDQHDIERQKIAAERDKVGLKLRPEDQEELNTLGKGNANKEAIVSQIDSVMKRWDGLSADEKYQQGQQLLKVLNSTEGKDAIGAGEADRLASQLSFAFGNMTNGNPTQFGRDLEGFGENARLTSKTLKDAVMGNRSKQNEIRARYGQTGTHPEGKKMIRVRNKKTGAIGEMPEENMKRIGADKIFEAIK